MKTLTLNNSHHPCQLSSIDMPRFPLTTKPWISLLNGHNCKVAYCSLGPMFTVLLALWLRYQHIFEYFVCWFIWGLYLTVFRTPSSFYLGFTVTVLGGTIDSAGDWSRVRHMQGKCLNPSMVSLALILITYIQVLTTRFSSMKYFQFYLCTDPF